MTKRCKKCSQTNVWCKDCNVKQFQKDFPNWTSGNEFIDRFIQETQLNAQIKCQVLEWIPYDKFKNIEYLDYDNFSAIYKVIWLDIPIKKWMEFNEKHHVTLKSLNNSSNLNEEFLNEVKC